MAGRRFFVRVPGGMQFGQSALLSANDAVYESKRRAAGSSGQGYVDTSGNLQFDIGTTLSYEDWLGEGKKVAGFATGGAFTVGGTGGTDTTPVHFMATPGERVIVQTPEQQKSSSSGTVININVNGGDPQLIIATIKQALRTDPQLLSTSYARQG